MVGVGFLKENPLSKRLIGYLRRLLGSWERLRVPARILSLETLQQLGSFAKHLTEFNQKVADVQIKALNQLLDRIPACMPPAAAQSYSQHLATALKRITTRRENLEQALGPHSSPTLLSKLAILRHVALALKADIISLSEHRLASPSSSKSSLSKLPHHHYQYPSSSAAFQKNSYQKGGKQLNKRRRR